MPPRGHSSSSHSSSSRSSSSRSSSSRSSSSRSSRSSSSGPSARSSSSRSGGFGSFRSSSSRRSGGRGPSAHSTSTYTGSQSSYRTGGSANTYQQPKARPRYNQPSGFIPLVAYSTIRHLYGQSHDYDYYPNGWTNDQGQTFEAGYYDENGNRYGNVVVENQETILTCEYCGAQTKVLWKEGMIPNCEACGAPLRIDLQDKGQEPVYAAGTGQETTRARRGISPAKIILLIFAIMVVLRIVGNFVRNSYNSQSVSNVQEQTQMQDSIYVEEIGRTCYLDGDNYYDEETQCWFWYNEERSVWQYWYEGISSDYGDYGWMEYDYTSQKWYIETSKGNWEELPSSYSTDRLWHFGQSQANLSDSIYVAEIDRTCYRDGDMGYYDGETDCWFWYNEESKAWQYWYEDISSDFGDYDWMEYDYSEDQWYIETGEGRWEPLPFEYDTSELWHFEEK